MAIVVHTVVKNHLKQQIFILEKVRLLVCKKLKGIKTFLLLISHLRLLTKKLCSTRNWQFLDFKSEIQYCWLKNQFKSCVNLLVVTESSARLAKIEQDLWGAYFCSLFKGIRSGFNLNFSLLNFESQIKDRRQLLS